MAPSVAALWRCRLASSEDVLQGWIWDVAELPGFPWAVPDGKAAGESGVGCRWPWSARSWENFTAQTHESKVRRPWSIYLSCDLSSCDLATPRVLNVKDDSFLGWLLMAMLFSDKKIILVLSFIFSQPCFPFAFFVFIVTWSAIDICLCFGVYVCVIVQLPNNRLRWAATNYAEDQGEAWNCIRKASGLYVPLFSSQTTSLLSSVFQLF